MPLTIYRRPGGKVWHYRGTVSGRRLRGSARTEDKARAQRIAAEVEARAWKRRLDGPGALRASLIAPPDVVDLDGAVGDRVADLNAIRRTLTWAAASGAAPSEATIREIESIVSRLLQHAGAYRIHTNLGAT